ncbi:hypothetical protein [Georgenia alba]|uniref:DUF3137 domain-containing protein n=1 Tax=Georgenia alba TaxID=2233858 RepID=A0ABW2Q1W7_9MICO
MAGEFLVSLLPMLMFPLIIGLVIVLAVVGHKQTKKRRAALRAWAQAHGWAYTDNAPGLGLDLRGGPFGRGHSRSSTEAVWGTYQGWQGASWRYTYKITSGSGKSRRTRTYHHHVVSLQLPVPLPYIELSAENFLSRTFGNDVEFEDAAFNDAWHVRGDSPRATSDVIHPRMMERLMQPDLQGANLLYEGGRIFLWRRGMPDPAAIDAALRLLHELIELVPGFVWDNARGHGG